MVRRYKRIYRNKDKYSVEQYTCRTPTTDQWGTVTTSGQQSYQYAVSVVPDVDLQGMRKVKHFQLTFTNGTAGTSNAEPIYYALVYVPAGYSVNALQLAAPGIPFSAYEPNQYVISQGWLDFDGGPLRINSPLSRNLNSGDSISLVLGSYSQGNSVRYNISVRYAITLQ